MLKIPLILIGITILLSFSNNTTLDQLSSKLASSLTSVNFDLHTKQGNHADCLKPIKSLAQVQNKPQLIGVFHSSNQTTQYSNLFYTQKHSNDWSTINMMSQRGSQGFIYEMQVKNSYAYLVTYQLQNKQHGNTFAIRYYNSIKDLRNNFFMYQYQLSQFVDSKIVRNIGTPSIDSHGLIQPHDQEKNNLPDLSSYLLNIKFHFSPDGAHDYPGQGTLKLVPLRDFVKDGQWIGGCYQKYNDWKGVSNLRVMNAIRSQGGQGKIGQRDRFIFENRPYYLYEVNLNSNFDWRNWRIFLFGQVQGRAKKVDFNLDKVIDLANPHISSLQQNKFMVTFFIPSEAIVQNTTTKAGEYVGLINL